MYGFRQSVSGPSAQEVCFCGQGACPGPWDLESCWAPHQLTGAWLQPCQQREQDGHTVLCGSAALAVPQGPSPGRHKGLLSSLLHLLSKLVHAASRGLGISVAPTCGVRALGSQCGEGPLDTGGLSQPPSCLSHQPSTVTAI